MSPPVPTRDALLAILALAVSTLLTRAGLLVVGDRLRLSSGIEAALRFAPACALAALVVPEILAPAGTIDLSLENARWPAAIAAALLLVWRHTIVGAIGLGMAVYALVRLV